MGPMKVKNEEYDTQYEGNGRAVLRTVGALG